MVRARTAPPHWQCCDLFFFKRTTDVNAKRDQCPWGAPLQGRLRWLLLCLCMKIRLGLPPLSPSSYIFKLFPSVVSERSVLPFPITDHYLVKALSHLILVRSIQICVILWNLLDPPDILDTNLHPARFCAHRSLHTSSVRLVCWAVGLYFCFISTNLLSSLCVAFISGFVKCNHRH